MPGLATHKAEKLGDVLRGPVRAVPALVAGLAAGATLASGSSFLFGRATPVFASRTKQEDCPRSSPPKDTRSACASRARRTQRTLLFGPSPRSSAVVASGFPAVLDVALLPADGAGQAPRRVPLFRRRLVGVTFFLNLEHAWSPAPQMRHPFSGASTFSGQSACLCPLFPQMWQNSLAMRSGQSAPLWSMAQCEPRGLFALLLQVAPGRALRGLCLHRSARGLRLGLLEARRRRSRARPRARRRRRGRPRRPPSPRAPRAAGPWARLPLPSRRRPRGHRRRALLRNAPRARPSGRWCPARDRRALCGAAPPSSKRRRASSTSCVSVVDRAREILIVRIVRFA